MEKQETREALPRRPTSTKDSKDTPSSILSEDGLVTWDSPSDPKNPLNWSKSRKWLITGINSCLIMNVTVASSAPTAILDSIGREFNSSIEVADLVTTLFLVGYVFGPILWGPGSELLGRRPVFLASMICYTLFIFGQIFAQNMTTFLITRFLTGLFAAAPMTIGVIADIWAVNERGLANSVYLAMIFLGTSTGPVIGGAIAYSTLTWRWVFWVIFIFAAVCTFLAIIAFPETYTPVILWKKARYIRGAQNKDVYSSHDLQDWSPKGLLNRTLFRPFHMLFVEPILALITIYMSLIYGLLFALFQAFPLIFIEARHMSQLDNGLMFLFLGVGTTLGAAICYVTNLHYETLAEKWKGFPPPEERLYGAMIGVVLFVVGILWLGWTGNYGSVPWYVPGIGAIFVGAAITSVFLSFIGYIIDTYLIYAASALAVSTISRSAVAAAFPLFTIQMFTKLGLNWGCTLLGLVALVLSPAPFLFHKYGARIRQGSVYAPCKDLEIKQELEATSSSV